MSATTEAAPVIALRKSDRGPMAGGGTVTHEVYVDGRWVGWVYDTRRFTGSTFAGRRWLATWREDDDTAARWTSDTHRTRDAAVAALLERIRA